jgi:hypothetical protein
MKRDMDFVRDLLLQIETADKSSLKELMPPGDVSEESYEKLSEHLKMLIEEAGLVTGIAAHTMAYRNWLDMRLTWKGHEYLDNIRDPEIWKKTKEGVQKVGSFSLDLVSALAKGLIKKQIEKHTGVEIEL